MWYSFWVIMWGGGPISFFFIFIFIGNQFSNTIYRKRLYFPAGLHANFAMNQVSGTVLTLNAVFYGFIYLHYANTTSSSLEYILKSW